MDARERIHRGMLRESIADNLHEMGDDVWHELEDTDAGHAIFDAEDEVDDLAHDDLAPRRPRSFWDDFF